MDKQKLLLRLNRLILRHLDLNRLLIFQVKDKNPGISETNKEWYFNVNQIASLFDNYYQANGEIIRKTNLILEKYNNMPLMIARKLRKGNSISKDYFEFMESSKELGLIISSIIITDPEPIINMIGIHHQLTIDQIKSVMDGNYKNAREIFEKDTNNMYRLLDHIGIILMKDFN